ncbi:hypothetical protein Tco_1292157 [Tanacetum coccineum]
MNCCRRSTIKIYKESSSEFVFENPQSDHEAFHMSNKNPYEAIPKRLSDCSFFNLTCKDALWLFTFLMPYMNDQAERIGSDPFLWLEVYGLPVFPIYFLILAVIIDTAMRIIMKLSRCLSGIAESNMLRAFSLFLLALAASKVFGADTGPDEDVGSIVAWSPLFTDVGGGIGSASDTLLEFGKIFE